MRWTARWGSCAVRSLPRGGLRGTPPPARAPRASLAALVYGGLHLVYLPIAKEVVDACEVPEPPHGSLMTGPRREGQGGSPRRCRGARRGSGPGCGWSEYVPFGRCARSGPAVTLECSRAANGPEGGRDVRYGVPTGGLSPGRDRHRRGGAAPRGWLLRGRLQRLGATEESIRSAPPRRTGLASNAAAPDRSGKAVRTS